MEPARAVVSFTSDPACASLAAMQSCNALQKPSLSDHSRDPVTWKTARRFSGTGLPVTKRVAVRRLKLTSSDDLAVAHCKLSQSHLQNGPPGAAKTELVSCFAILNSFAQGGRCMRN
jgi:hypothetical protein